MVRNMWIIVVPLALFSLTAICNKEDSKITWILYPIFAFFYCIRGRVATDWEAYKYYFDNVNDAVISSQAGFEPGYYLLSKIFHNIGLSYWVMLFCISVFITTLFFLATERLTQNAGIAVLLGLFFFFYPSLEALRQIIAISIFYYSLQYIDRDWKKYFILNVIGILFHRTGILTLLYYFFHRYRKVKLPCLIGAAAFPLLNQLIIKIFSFFPGLLAKYLWYFGNLGGAQGFSYLLSLKTIEYVILTFIFIILRDKNENENNVKDLLEMGLGLQVFLSRVMSHVYRLVYFSDLGVILAYCYLYNRLKKNYQRVAFVLFLMLYVAVRFYRIISANPQLFS